LLYHNVLLRQTCAQLKVPETGVFCRIVKGVALKSSSCRKFRIQSYDFLCGRVGLVYTAEVGINGGQECLGEKMIRAESNAANMVEMRGLVRDFIFKMTLEPEDNPKAGNNG
jgi:hypothetical protein